MKLRPRLLVVLLTLGLSTVLMAFQFDDSPRWRFEEGPTETNEKAEFTFGRLRFATRAGSFGGWRRAGWAEDFPKADRQFVEGVRRLTRLDARKTEKVLDLDSDEIFNWPWIYAVNVGRWDFTDAQAKRMREYLLRGGFLLADSFHGAAEWETFLAGMRKVFPARPVEDLKNSDELFHVLYDLDKRFQIPGYQYIWTGRTYERDGIEPHWRAIRDDKGRILVAICHNMHVGDSWEHADDPRYPERFSSLGYRLGINYIMYAMTH
jgi:Domain of unknown function (DUF4159)